MPLNVMFLIFLSIGNDIDIGWRTETDLSNVVKKVSVALFITGFQSISVDTTEKMLLPIIPAC